jgi:hypothetical protein
MCKSEIIIENVNTTMSMEDIPLFESVKTRINECIEGKVEALDIPIVIFNRKNTDLLTNQ